ncbi:uncharacterized protein [Haliotis asinina]|uniref:uncharacterized protein n=1 Tax=Haliotis asinina TaxID=109174 RepID=UPI003531B28F
MKVPFIRHDSNDPDWKAIARILFLAMDGNVDDEIQEDIIDIISTHDGRGIPNPENLTKVIGEIAHKELIQEPMYAKACWFDQLTIDASGKQNSLAVRFNTLKGLDRRPGVHVCGYVLELPEQYDNYLQFRSEFTAVLKSDMWIMDFM